MKLVASFAAIVALGSASPAAAPSIAEQSVAAVMTAPPATNAVWPGYSLPERDWAVQDETGVYLVTRSQPPASFVARGRWYFRREPLPDFGAGFELQYPLGDLRIVAVRAKPSVEQTVSLLYHEAFHEFQRGWEDPASVVDYGTIGSFLPTQAASIEVERRILRDAIRAKGADPTLARRATAVRLLRSAGVTTEFIQAERRAERTEGLAAYVEARSVQLAFRKSPSAAVEDIGEQLAVPMRTFGGSPDERLIRTRGYGTGAAIALLLDRLAGDWKRRVPAEPLDALLAEAAGTPDPQTATEAHRRYGYDALLRDSPSPWGSLEVMSEPAFDRLRPYRLVLDLPAGARIGWSTAGSSFGGMHRPAPGVLLMPMVKSLAVNHAGVSMQVEQRPVKLAGSEFKVMRTVITVLLDEAPGLDGRRVEPGMDTSRSDLRLVGPGVTLTIAGAARVVSLNDRITITR